MWSWCYTFTSCAVNQFCGFILIAWLRNLKKILKETQACFTS